MTFGAADALNLLDWKRQVFALYERVRANSDPRSAWEDWRDTRDRLYREHPQSPVPAKKRADFPGSLIACSRPSLARGPVVPVDHSEARSHVAREIEG